MAKLELKGTIKEVSEIVEIGEKKTLKQTIIINIPAYQDEWGDVKGKEEHWSIDIMGKENIEKHKFNHTYVGMKGTFRLWLNSKLVPSKVPGSPDMYIINALLADAKFKA